METKTKTTKERYINNAIRIKKMCFKEALLKNPKVAENKNEIKHEQDKIIVLNTLYTAGWMLKYHSKSYKPNTWRQYRASLIFFAEQELAKNKIKKETFEKIKTILNSTSGGDKKNLPDRTSAMKKKNINEKDFFIISDALKKSNNRWAKVTLIWLKAGILTGLRPIEWRTAQINNTKTEIKVKNAKNTNGRAHGEHRIINLEHLSKEEISIVEQNLNISKQFEENQLWQSYYIGCSNILRYTSRKVLKNRKKYPTLYTGRHQYSANLKATGCSPNEIAALMGHSSDQTNQSHYGRRRYGKKGKVKPKANVNDLKNVNIKIKEKPFKFQ